MFERIKKWYLQKLWTEQMVLKAAEKGVLTQQEAEEILCKENDITHTIVY